MDQNTGDKQWQLYKEVHQYVDQGEEQRQHMKRKYYQEVIDKEFEVTVETNLEAEMKEFQMFC